MQIWWGGMQQHNQQSAYPHPTNQKYYLFKTIKHTHGTLK